jgi:predicted nucleic acid-binding protein
MRFVDTNVLLYSISTKDEEATKAAKAQAALASHDLALSVQVLQEFYVQATRKSRPDPLTHDEALSFIHSWRRFPTFDITLAVMDAALEIKARYQLSYWDSAIVAAAQAGDCSEILSEDMSDGVDYAGVKVVNPFKR